MNTRRKAGLLASIALCAPLLGCGSCDEDEREILGFLLLLSGAGAGLTSGPEDASVTATEGDDDLSREDGGVPFEYRDAGE